MKRLVLLYEHMKRLRESGVKMKDISERTDIASSVLSSLYHVRKHDFKRGK